MGISWDRRRLLGNQWLNLSADVWRRFSEALAELGEWIAEGRIVQKYHIVRGLERAPGALPLFFTRGNTGKLFVSSPFQPQFLVLTPSFPLELPRVDHVPDPEAKTKQPK
jgi:hypothetical protein